MALLDDVKDALRISGTDLDTEILDLIEAAKADLALGGVLSVDETDPLIKRAIIVYCKSNFGWDNTEAERFQNSYDLLKKHISMSSVYAYYAVTFTVTYNSLPVDEVSITFNDVTQLTNSLGVTVFYVKEGNNYVYEVIKSGYTSLTTNLDVAANKAINIVLTVS